MPAAYVRLEALPLTPNGKLDRRALPAPGGRRVRARAATRRRAGEAEQALAEIWAELLGVERVGRTTTSSSWAATRCWRCSVISRVRQALGVEVALARRCSSAPVLADFARGAARRPRARSCRRSSAWIARGRAAAVVRAAAALVPGAARRPGRAPTTSPRGCGCAASWTAAALRRALDAIVARHEALRTTFAEVDGEPVQRIAPPASRLPPGRARPARATPDAEAELRRLAAEEAGAPFDLERGPLIRGRLVRLAADDHVLLLTMHHIVSDGWSMGVLVARAERAVRRLRARRARSAPAAAGAVRRLRGLAAAVGGRARCCEAQAEYWKRALAGAPELLELPTDRPRPARQDHAGASREVDAGRGADARR